MSNLFELQKEFVWTKLPPNKTWRKWGEVISFKYQVEYRTRLVGGIHSNEISRNLYSQGNWLLQVPSLIMDKSHYLSQNCFNPKREQIHSNEISWNLFSQGNFSRVANSFNLLPELVNVHQDKFVRLLIQVRNSATSLDRAWHGMVHRPGHFVCPGDLHHHCFLNLGRGRNWGKGMHGKPTAGSEILK